MTKELIFEENGRGGIVLYQSPDGQTSLDVKLENETVWLTQAQMSVLFETTKQNVSLHINNIFKENELEREVVVKDFFTTTKHGAIEGKIQRRKTAFYNLDVIISVGYRVKSLRGTQFRIWASSILKNYLVKGYVVKSEIYKERYDELRALVDTMGRTMQYLKGEDDEQIKSIFDVVRDYTYALDTLDRYDYQTLEVEGICGEEKFHATYETEHEKF